MPRVSVIIPAFNAEAYIGETLCSVEAQTYRDWEVVIGDDRSTDGTAEIAATFGKRVKVVPSPENAGPATARNLALEHASGELIALLDADDFWVPAYLDEQVGLFDAEQARDGNVGIVACDARILAPDGFLPQTYAQLVDAPETITVADLLRFNPIFGGAMSPRALVDRAGGFNPDIFGAEDRDLWLKIVELGYRVATNPAALAVYRVTAASVSSNAASMARAVQTLYRSALERGNLTPRERRIARRELRLNRAVERVASGEGSSYGRILRALPLLAVVAVEHPRRWPSYARMLTRRGSPFFVRAA